jgi:hypothetical protein
MVVRSAVFARDCSCSRDGPAVAVAARLQELGDFVQCEPEPLSRLDRLQRGHRSLPCRR